MLDRIVKLSGAYALLAVGTWYAIPVFNSLFGLPQ